MTMQSLDPFRHFLAVIIGIDAYEHGIPRLTTAVNDATRLGRGKRSDRLSEKSPWGVRDRLLPAAVDSVRFQVRLSDLLRHALELHAAALCAVAYPPTLSAPLADGFNVSANYPFYLAPARFS